VVTGEKGGHSWKRQVHVQNLEKEDRLVVWLRGHKVSSEGGED
jgi:hypothetical protein